MRRGKQKVSLPALLAIAETLAIIQKHMNKTLIISSILIAVTFFQEVRAQKVDATALKEIELIKKVTYGMGAELFKTQHRLNRSKRLFTYSISMGR